MQFRLTTLRHNPGIYQKKNLIKIGKIFVEPIRILVQL